MIVTSSSVEDTGSSGVGRYDVGERSGELKVLPAREEGRTSRRSLEGAADREGPGSILECKFAMSEYIEILDSKENERECNEASANDLPSK